MHTVYEYLILVIYVIGAGAVEFILCHAEVSIAFVEEKKIDEVSIYIWNPRIVMGREQWGEIFSF